MSLLSSSRFGGGGGQQQNSELESQIVNTVKQVDLVSVLVSLSNSLAGYGCCGQARPVGVLLLLACQRLCKCPWNGRYLSWGDEDGSLSGEFKIVKHFKLRIVMLGQDCWHRRPVFCQGQRSFGGISGSLHMLAFYLQRLQVSCALSQGKRNILKNPDPGLRQTLVKIYNKVKVS